MARALVASGKGDGTIFADEKADGLILRVRKSGAAFAVKWNGKTQTLGPLSPSSKEEPRPGEIGTISKARELAGQIRAMLRDGTDPAAFLTGKAAGKSDEAATASAEEATAIAGGAWTWEKLVDEYTDGYLGKPRRAKGNTIRQPSAKSVRTARKSLTVPEADSLNGKLLTEIKAGDFEKVRNECRDAGRFTASRAFVSNARAAMSFAKRKYKGDSGLDAVAPWWLGVEILEETAIASRTRMPSVEGLARTLYLAEKHRVMPGRKNRRVTTESVLCGLWWIALTAQRTGAGLALEREHILPWKGGREGWKVCLWSETVMKSRRYHALPIPPRAVLLLQRAIAGGREDSKFVFPSTAVRQGEGDKPISISSPKNLLDRLRGRPIDLGKPLTEEEKERRKTEPVPALPDILGEADVPHFSPHDIRRLFATTCGDRSVRGDAISAVLDHAGIETGQKLVRSAEVTRLAYDYSQKLELKAIAMEMWTDALFNAVESEWRSHRLPPRPGRPILHPTGQATDSKGRRRFSNIEPWYIAMEREAAEAERAYLATILEPWEMDDSPEHQAWLRMRYEEEVEEMQRAGE
jgi:integrase